MVLANRLPIGCRPNFDASQWSLGTGGFGYGDNDDNTIVSNTISVYLRKEFEVVDINDIGFAVLHADYDDAFVAYLNVVEFARNNIGQAGIPPPHNETSIGLHEATMYNGGNPEAYMLYGQILEDLLVEGSNTLSIQVHNQSFFSSDLTSNFFFSVGVASNIMNYDEPPSWFSPPIFTSNLPLVIINTTETPEIYDESKVPADMGIIDNGAGQLNTILDDYNEYDGQIAIEIRGASSQGFPKKNYGFETQFEDGSNNNVSLLGMPAENDWVLHGPFSDKSLLRNALAYHMGRATGRYSPRTRLCELFVNGDYKGVYIFTERIKRDANRVDIAKLTIEDIEGDELTGGYILQVDRDDPFVADDGWYSSYSPLKFYAFDDPDYDELLQVQREYIMDYINTFEFFMNDANYENTYSNFVDVNSWIDYFLVTEIGKHIDAYKLSFFLYKKKDSNGGKLHFGPLWDFNLGFGNYNYECSPEPEGWAYEFGVTCINTHPFWVNKLADIPEVSNLTNCRWWELREGPLHTDSLMLFIDEKAEMLEEAQSRNFERWPTLGEYVWPNDFIGETYEEEVLFMKNWLLQRLDWMDENMIGDCEIISSSEVKNNSALKVDVFPNPSASLVCVEVKNIGYQRVVFEMFDVFGNQRIAKNIDSQVTKIDIEALEGGMYIYTLKEGDLRIEVGNFIKISSGN